MSDSQVTGINYFDHQFLRQKDFTIAQDYHIARLQQHNQLLHRPGIVKESIGGVDGLSVTKTGPRSVLLNLGHAIDKNYREVILSQDSLPLVRIQKGSTDFQESEPTPTAQGLQLDLSAIPASNAFIYLTIRQEPKSTTLSSDPGTTDKFTRLIERPVIEASTDDPGTIKLILAKLTLTGGVIDNAIDLSGRELAGATLAPNSVSESNLDAATQGKLVPFGSSLNITGNLNTGGNMGIGIIPPALPAQKLDVNGTINATGYRLNGAVVTFGSQWIDITGGVAYPNNVTVGANSQPSPQNALFVNGQAVKTLGGTAWGTASCDIRFKKNIQPLQQSLDKILQLQGVSFEWKEPEKFGNETGSVIGMVAQDVEKVFPKWVTTKADGYKILTLVGFEALTVEALRELKTENEALKALTQTLEKRIQVLEGKLNLTTRTVPDQ